MKKYIKCKYKVSGYYKASDGTRGYGISWTGNSLFRALFVVIELFVKRKSGIKLEVRR